MQGLVEEIQTAIKAKDPRAINQLRGGYKPRTKFIKDGRGDLLTQPEAIVGR